MEIEQAWAPMISEQEIKERGILLNSSLLVEPDMARNSLKIYCKLYYLKHRDLFVTVINDFKTINDVHPIQIVSDSGRIRSFKHDYLGEMTVDSRDSFAEYDTSEYPAYMSDINIHDHETVKKNGRYLGKSENGGADIYYIETSDAFASIVSGDHAAHLFQSHVLRKKYNIPYQDERFENMNF